MIFSNNFVAAIIHELNNNKEFRDLVLSHRLNNVKTDMLYYLVGNGHGHGDGDGNGYGNGNGNGNGNGCCYSHGYSYGYSDGYGCGYGSVKLIH